MVICAAGNNVVAFIQETGSHSLGIFYNLLGIYAKLRLQYLVEGNCLGGNNVFQRATLGTGENCEIDELAHHADLAFRAGDAEWVFEILFH